MIKPMRIFVINLERDAERLAFVAGQLESLGLAFERVSAVDAQGLSEEERRRAVNGFVWRCATGRSVRPAEIGCALSHYGIYGRMTEPVCILEDDVELQPGFLEALERVGEFIDPERPQVVMLSDMHSAHAALGPAGSIVRSAGGMCTDGYVITPSAARAILRVNLPLEAPCDAWSRWTRRGLIELYHALPAAVAQRQDLFGSSTSPDLAKPKRRRSVPDEILHKCARAVELAVDELRWRLTRRGLPEGTNR